MRADLIAKVQAALQDRIVQTVAERTGLSQNTISALRDGKTGKRGPNSSTVKILADYLGVES